MYICSLPDVVLRLIISAAVNDCDDVSTRLATGLPLLAVCKRWRELGLHLVYSGVFIRYGADPDIDEEEEEEEEEEEHHSDNEVESAEITTNFDLVASAGCLHTVRVVAIDVHHRQEPFPGIAAVLGAMRVVAERWDSVRELEITMHPDQDGWYDQDDPRWEAAAREACAALAALLPGLRKVWFGGADYDMATSRLYGQVAAAYASQLRVIDGAHSIAVPEGCMLTQLRSMCLRYDEECDYSRLRVDPARLVNLELIRWPVNFAWATFAADPSRSEEIEFPNLKTLDVSYDTLCTGETAVEAGPVRRLRLPWLRRLKVYSAMPGCRLLDHAVLPARMNEISISVAAPQLRHLLDVSLPSAARLKIGVITGADHNTDYLSTACRVLERAQGDAMELGLYVYDVSLPVVPELVTCTSLTSLFVGAATGVDAVLGLIRRLPCLASLKIWNLELGDADVQADSISVPAPGDGHVLEPFDTRIRELSINTQYVRHHWEEIIPVAKHLLLRIPTLLKFATRQIPEDPIMDFVDEYFELYPHLNDIVFELGQD